MLRQHPPSRRLIVSNLEERMEEARLNIAATQIQKIVRGILGRKYVASFVPNNAATNIQRVVRGRWGRRRAHRRLIFETNRKSATKPVLLRKATFGWNLALLLSELSFSGGHFSSAWRALAMQRKASEDYKPEAHEDLALLRLGIWYHTMNCQSTTMLRKMRTRSSRWWFGRIEC